MSVFLWRSLENLWEHTEMMSKLGVVGVTLPQLSELLLLVSAVARTVRPNWDQFSNWSLSQWTCLFRCWKVLKLPTLVAWAILNRMRQKMTEATISVSRPFKHLRLERGHSCWWILHFFAGHLPFSSLLPSIFGGEIPMFLAYCHSFHHPKCFAPSSWHWPKVASPAMWAKFTASMSGLLSTGGQIQWACRLVELFETSTIWWKHPDLVLQLRLYIYHPWNQPRLRVKSRNIPDFTSAETDISGSGQAVRSLWGFMLSCWIFPAQKIMQIWGVSAKLDDSSQSQHVFLDMLGAWTAGTEEPRDFPWRRIGTATKSSFWVPTHQRSRRATSTPRASQMPLGSAGTGMTIDDRVGLGPGWGRFETQLSSGVF